MGLDIYVGTLTRYYAGEWETAVHTAATSYILTLLKHVSSVHFEVNQDASLITGRLR
jgi:hypothetical protein